MTTTSKAFLLVFGSALAVFGQGPFSKCDLNQDGSTNVADVQRIINQALGVSAAANDLNGDGVINVVDVQIVINAALILGCAADPPPTIRDFNPKSGPVGTLVTVTGSNFGSAPQILMPKQGGGTIGQPLSSLSSGSVSFVVVAGTATGAITVGNGNAGSSTSSSFTVNPSSTFSLTASPASASLIQGQSVAYLVKLTSSTGFNQLAALAISGAPTGVAVTLKPSLITAGQIAVLTLTAPASQPIATTNLSITASATVDGIAETQSAPLSLAIVVPTTSFLGRTVVSDSLETPLAGVTVSMLGKDGNGNTTGCIGTTVSDAAGNFSLVNLSASCVGPQLVGFDGATATAPAGKYAGVNIVYTLVLGQVTASPVLVHLPRIDNQETFQVTQNAATDQSYSYASIPGLFVTVYAGTTFTMPDGTTPNPFPLTAVQVPLDRLPDSKPTVPTMMMVFIVAFQPANATASQPVAVTYPNVINTPSGTNMVLMTLDPTHGQMVPYGTGTVSANATQIVPDADPAHAGHLYGLVHFDWHGPMPPPANTTNPGAGSGGTGNGAGDGGCSGGGGAPPPNSCPDVGQPPQTAEPVDLASGLYVSNVTDMVLSSSRGSVAIHRIYRTLSTNDGPFGVGSGSIYNYSLDTAFVNGAQAINLINPDGSRFLFSRQPNGTLINTTVPSLQGAVMTTTSSNQANLRYKNGSVIVFQQYGLLSLEVSVSDANENQITLNRDAGNPQQIDSISDPVGRALVFTYVPGTNHLASITDPIGRVVSYTYDGSGNLATVTDPAGGVTKYSYDSQNRLSSVIDPRGTTVLQNVFDANGRVIQQTEGDDGVVHISYELANPAASTSFVRDVTVLDARGNPWFYRFNPQGFVIMVVDALGQTTTFNRDPGTNLVLSKTGNANCPVCGPAGIGDLFFTYDSNGNQLSRTDALGATTRFTREPVFGKVTSVTDANGNMTAFTYDSRGNMVTQTDANGNDTTYKYDFFGETTQIVDALNQRTSLAYDGFGNLVSVTDPLANVTTYAYDRISRLSSTTDSLSRTTTFSYDALNRLLTQTDAKGGMSQFSYDANGNLLSMKDARNNITTFSYDTLNRLSTRTDLLGRSDVRSYDKKGNLVEFTNRRGQSSAFTYDALGRLTGETYPDATVKRAYDSQSRLSQVNDSAVGVFTLAYDPVGRLVNSSTPNGAINYVYDARGAMLTRQVAGQAALSYSYDAAGNLVSAALPRATANFSYDVGNQLVSISRSNGVSTSYAYDAAARLLSVIHAKGSTLIDTEGYGYDAIGNRNSHATDIGQSLITQSTANQFNLANQLIQFGPTPDSYDSNGNLIQEGTTTTYTWDARNRLKSMVTTAGQTANFTYDYAGNLIQQADSGTSLNLTRFFVLDNITNVAYEAASDGTSYSVLDGRWIDSSMAIVQSDAQVLYGLTDAINSAIATSDQNGATKSQLDYEPYGQTTGVGGYPFRFAGRTLVAPGLYYNRARYYSTQQGRFISEDPLGIRPTRSAYAYAENQPLSRTDPLGLQSTPGYGGVTGQGSGFPGSIVAVGTGFHPCIDGEVRFGSTPCGPGDPPKSPPSHSPSPRSVKCTLEPECTFSGGSCKYQCPKGVGEVTRWSSPEPCPTTIDVQIGPLGPEQ
jgi:RHS repeat-associated protein